MEKIRYGCELETDLKGVIAFVEASDYEKSRLWRDHSKDSMYRTFHVNRDGEIGEPLTNLQFDWVQQGSGYLPTIGEALDKPVTLSIWFATIGGHRVMFYDSPSQLVYHPMIQSYLKRAKKLTGRDEVTMVDADNFFRVLHYIQESNKT